MDRWWSTSGRVEDRVATGVAAFVVLSVAVIPSTGLLWRLGAPSVVVRAVGLLPDLGLAALVVAGLGVAWQRRQRPDGLDLAVGALAGVVVVAFLLGVVGGGASVTLRLLGARAMVWGLVLMVALRCVDAPASDRERVVRVVLALAGVVAAVAVLEALWADGWEWFGTVVLGMHDVQREVYGVVVPKTLVVRTPVAGRSLVRAGSLLFEYLQLGFWLLPALGMGLVRAARRPTWRRVMLVALLAAGIAASLGRAAIASAALVGLVLAVTRPAGPQRRRLLVGGGAATLALLAVAVPTGLLVRLLETFRGGEASTDIHLDASGEAVRAVMARPWGHGLGTGFAASARAGADARIAENAYLDVALQVGVVGLVVFVVVVALLWWHLWRQRPWDDLAVGAVSGVIGLTVGGLLLHTWQMLETSWLVLALAGLSLPRRS